jgi:hypothetical protein
MQDFCGVSEMNTLTVILVNYFDRLPKVCWRHLALEFAATKTKREAHDYEPSGSHP